MVEAIVRGFLMEETDRDGVWAVGAIRIDTGFMWTGGQVRG